jgi:hypothetical protein
MTASTLRVHVATRTLAPTIQTRHRRKLADRSSTGTDAKFPLELKVHSRNELQRVGAR